MDFEERTSMNMIDQIGLSVNPTSEQSDLEIQVLSNKKEILVWQI